MPISRNQFFNKLNSQNNPFNSKDYHEKNRTIASNLIKERSIYNLSNLVNNSGIQTKVNYFYQIVPEGSQINTNSPNQISDNLIEYGCIRDLPVIFNEQTSYSEEGDEILKSFTNSGSAIILPNTIMPKINDYFSLFINDRYLLYRIEKVERSEFHNSPARTITFHLDLECGKDFVFDNWKLKNNIKEYKTFISKFVGTDYKPIVSDFEKEDLERMTRLYDTLKYIYISEFYDKRCNSFLMKYLNFDFEKLEYKTNKNYNSDSKYNHDLIKNKYTEEYYDPLMLQFIKSNGLFDRTDGNLLISPQHLYQIDFDQYDKSIYKSIEEIDLSYYLYRHQSIHKITKISPFHNPVLYNKFIVSYYDTKSGINNRDFYPEEFDKTIFSKNIYDDPTSHNYTSPTEIMLEIIGLYLNKLEDNAILERLRLLEYNKSKLVLTNIYPTNAFYLYPLVAYICVKTIDKMFKNNITI